MSEYEATLAWLYALEAAKGMDFKLERIQLALESLGNPHHRYRVIHIAGTNGKGSVAAISHAVLCAAGHRVGLYTSPHLVRFTERIRVDDREIPEEAVVELVAKIRADVTSRGIDLTFFELTTVVAFLHFAVQQVEIAVVEVGLGGRLDATNVLDPNVAVITTISLDHEEFLGGTVAQIAAEKGGIIKPGRPVVMGAIVPQAKEVLMSIAAERNSPASILGRDFVLEGDDSATYSGLRHRWSGLRLSLLGRFQRDNAATALAAIEHLAREVAVPEDAVQNGLVGVRWPGRLEIVGTDPRVILDGAHNVAAITALIRDIEPWMKSRYVRLVFAVMQDKQWLPMAHALAAIAHEVTVTTALPPRGESPERLAEVFRKSLPTRIVSDPIQALSSVWNGASADDVILVTGSLFLIGAIHKSLRRQQGRVRRWNTPTP